MEFFAISRQNGRTASSRPGLQALPGGSGSDIANQIGEISNCWRMCPVPVFSSCVSDAPTLELSYDRDRSQAACAFMRNGEKRFSARAVRVLFPEPQALFAFNAIFFSLFRRVISLMMQYKSCLFSSRSRSEPDKAECRSIFADARHSCPTMDSDLSKTGGNCSSSCPGTDRHLIKFVPRCAPRRFEAQSEHTYSAWDAI